MKKFFCIMLLFIFSVCLLGCNNQEDGNGSKQIGVEVASIDKLKKLYNQRNNNHNYFFDICEDDAISMPAESSTGETSKTTIQEAGVDEINKIKNDDRYIYFASGSCLTIVDTKTEQTNSISLSAELDEDEQAYYKQYCMINGIYLQDNYLIVIYQNTSLCVNVYDCTTPLELTLIRSLSYQNAYYYDSRVIGDYLYLFGMASIFDDGEVCLPYYSDLEGGKKQIAVDDIYILTGYQYYGGNLSFISSINYTNGEECSFQGLYGNGFNMFYVSTRNIYIINQYYTNWSEKSFFNILIPNQSVGMVTMSAIYRIAIDDGRVEYKSFQTITGSIYDSYALSEYDGVLRVAVTYTKEANNKIGLSNAVYTFDCQDEKFALLDCYEGFGDGESIYSVTYSGYVGYVVTYMYIDPLFEFDFSSPSDIKLIRQLETPGVSKYLDKINEKYVLGIGLETEVHQSGDYQYATSIGVKISLYSLYGNEMLEKDTFLMSTYKDVKYSYTSATNNPHLIIKLDQSLVYLFPVTMSSESAYSNNMFGCQIDLENEAIMVLGDFPLDYLERAVVINGYIYLVSPQKKQVYVYEISEGLPLLKTI